MVVGDGLDLARAHQGPRRRRQVTGRVVSVGRAIGRGHGVAVAARILDGQRLADRVVGVVGRPAQAVGLAQDVCVRITNGRDRLPVRSDRGSQPDRGRIEGIGPGRRLRRPVADRPRHEDAVQVLLLGHVALGIGDGRDPAGVGERCRACGDRVLLARDHVTGRVVGVRGHTVVGVGQGLQVLAAAIGHVGELGQTARDIRDLHEVVVGRVGWHVICQENYGPRRRIVVADGQSIEASNRVVRKRQRPAIWIRDAAQLSAGVRQRQRVCRCHAGIRHAMAIDQLV